MRPLLIVSAFLACIALWSGSARAETFTAAGLSFSDELGGFRLISASGAGTIADPIVLVEEITQVGPAVLVVRGAQLIRHQSQQTATSSFIHLAVIKIVINGTGRVWAGFDLELQEVPKQPSPYEDGLSFDQLGSFAGERFQSDGFTNARRVSEPYDRVRFHGGAVDPGQAVRFNFYITDPTPKPEFFLLQEPKLLIASVPGSAGQMAATPAGAAR
jgi:hypothetical protein